MIIKFNSYINESKGDITLKYVALDWDDNILHMPTVIHMDHLINGEWVPTDVSTSKFAEIRTSKDWRIINNDGEAAFSEFRDNGKRGDNAFLDDTKKAIQEGNFGPSWNVFIKYLIKGSIFAIVTARGHEPSGLRKGVEYIIDNILNEDQKNQMYSNCLKFAYIFNNDYESYDRIYKGELTKTPLIKDYLDTCDFYGVSSNYCIDKFGLGDASNPEKAKEMAIKDFTKKVHSFGQKIGAKNVHIGFSDDDIRNVNHIENLFKNELSLEYALKYNVYNTSKKGLEGGVRTLKDYKHNESQANWGSGANTWGSDSSVLPFSKWNSMQSMSNSSVDQPADGYHNQFKNEIGQIKDLTNGLYKNKRKDKNEKTKKVRKFQRSKSNK